MHQHITVQQGHTVRHPCVVIPRQQHFTHRQILTGVPLLHPPHDPPELSLQMTTRPHTVTRGRSTRPSHQAGDLQTSDRRGPQFTPHAAIQHSCQSRDFHRIMRLLHRHQTLTHVRRKLRPAVLTARPLNHSKTLRNTLLRHRNCCSVDHKLQNTSRMAAAPAILLF